MTSPGGLVASSVRSSAVWPVLVGVAVLAGATAAGIGALSLADALTATGLPEPRPGHHLRTAVRAGGGRDRRGRGRRLVPVRGVPGAAAGQRCSRRRRLPRAAARHRRVGGLDGVRGPAGAADGVGCLRAAAARAPRSGQHLVGCRASWTTAGAWRWTAFLAAAVTLVSLPVLRWSWTPMLLVGALITLAAARSDRAFVGRRCARPGHQQPADPPRRGRAVGGRTVGAAGPRDARAGSTPTWPRGGSRRWRCGASSRWLSAVWSTRWCGSSCPIWCTPNTAGWSSARSSRCVCSVCSAGASAAAAWRRCKPTRTHAAPLIRLALAEAVVFGATFGIAVGLGRTPPPPLLDEPSSGGGRDRLRLRRAADRGAGAVRLAVRPDLRHRRDRPGGAVPGSGCAGCAGAATPGRWAARWRGCCGCAVLLFTTSSGLGRYMPAMFCMHMVAHMLLSMLVPVLLVLGGPMTLALRALPTAGRDEPPGPREWLLAALHSRVSRFLTHPIVAHGAVRRGFLRPVLRRHLRRRGQQSRRARADERALPAQRLPLLLGGDRRRPDAAAAARSSASWRWCSPRCRCTRSSASC